VWFRLTIWSDPNGWLNELTTRSLRRGHKSLKVLVGRVDKNLRMVSAHKISDDGPRIAWIDQGYRMSGFQERKKP
jgi:hypothetical protein